MLFGLAREDLNLRPPTSMIVNRGYNIFSMQRREAQ